jgi:hypothetical protein
LKFAYSWLDLHQVFRCASARKPGAAWLPARLAALCDDGFSAHKLKKVPMPKLDLAAIAVHIGSR